MTRSITLICALLVALATGFALAADVTGKWTGQVNGPNGDGFTLTFNFKQDGTKLTGSIEGPGGEPIPIKDGKVEGDKISFWLSFDAGGGEMKITHDGTINGDEITLNTKMEGGQGDTPAPMKLTRVK
jgi:autotransporter translocation and assembly factor TamB